MQAAGEKFTIVFDKLVVNVQPYTHLNRTLYRVLLPNDPIIITKAEKENGKPFWTSVPQGRQKLAEQLGKIIDQAPDEPIKQQSLF